MLQASTRVVVIPVAIDSYDKPGGAEPGRCSRFDELPGVRADLVQLKDLFDLPRFRGAGFEMVEPIAGKAGDISAQLLRWKTELRQRPDVTVLLFWSGHGRTVGNELRLITRECLDPVDASDGLGPEQIVGPLADAQLRALVIFLDVCQASAASAALIASAARRAFERSPEHSFSFGALLSAYPYQPARDGVFVTALVRLLRDGPTAKAEAEIRRQEWETFGVRTRMLSLPEIQDVLAVEFDLLKASQPAVATPTAVHMSDRAPRVIPNPRYVADVPPRSMERSASPLLEADVEGHFLPKARGLEPGEEGWFFTGRATVTRRIVEWLAIGAPRTAKDGLFVLCGDGGTGKSAVVGRLVTLSDPVLRERARSLGWNESADQAIGSLPPPGWFDAALHLRRRTTEQAAVALSELLGRPVVDRASLLQNARRWGDERQHPLTIVLDALDEADEPSGIAADLVLPLLEAGWRILVATRRHASHAGAADLVGLLQPTRLFDLDVDTDTNADIARYVVRRLELAAMPYDTGPAQRIGAAVAARAAGKFLYARIAAAALLRRPGPLLAASSIDEWLAVDLASALTRELMTLDQAFRQAFGRSDAGATALFGALAWSEGQGLPSRDGLWAATASAVGEVPIDPTQAAWLLREGGRFIVESGDGEQAVYRLYHQSLIDHFRNAPGHEAAARRVALALAAQKLPKTTWRDENPYLIRHLAAHLAMAPDRARLLTLLMDPDWTKARLTVGGVTGLLSDHERYAEPPSGLRAITDALRRSAQVLAGDPDQLAPQLLARLMDNRQPEVEAFLAGLTASERGPWLRPVTASLAGERSIRSMRGIADRALDSVTLSRNGSWAAYVRDTDIVVVDLQRWTSRGVAFRTAAFSYGLAVDDAAATGLAADSTGGVYRWRRDGSPGAWPEVHDEASMARLLRLGSDGRHGLSAASSRKGQVIAWDFETDRHEVLSRLDCDNPTALALDGTGRHGVLGCADGSVRLFRTWPFVRGARFTASGQVLAVAQTPDLDVVAIGSSDCIVEVRNTSSLRRRVMRKQLSEQPRCVALSDDGLLLAVGTDKGSIEVWDIASATRCARYAGAHTYEVLQIVFQAGGERLVSADLLHLKQWDTRAADPPAPGSPVKSDLVAEPVDGLVLGILQDGSLGRWSLSSGSPSTPLASTSLKVTEWKGVIGATDSPRVLAWGDHGLAVWDMAAGKLLLECQAEQLKAAAVSSDGRLVVCVDGPDVIARDLDGSTATLLGRYPSFETPRSVAITADGSRVLSAGGDRTVHVWSTESPSAKEIATWDVRTSNKPDQVFCIAGNVAVVVTTDGEVLTLDPQLKRFQSTRPLQGRHSSSLTGLRSFEDGDRFATSSHDGTVRLWSIAAGGCTHVFDFQREPVNLQQLAPASNRMLVNTFAGALKILSLEDGATIVRFQGDKQYVSAAGSADLESVAAVDQSGGIHFFRLELPH